MLAEIFMLRLEEKAREGKEAAVTTSSRFVPVTLPVVKDTQYKIGEVTVSEETTRDVYRADVA